MYRLKNNSILQPYQIKLLQTFFATDFSKTFYLTGGTALAAFYFGHRESRDLDLFTHSSYSILILNQVINRLSKATNSKVASKVKTDNYNEIYLKNHSEGWMQRIDVVEDIPKRFGKIVEIDSIRVDSLENIGSNKILAIFGRTEPKDFIDLYFILQNSKLTFPQLFELAQQKDLGLSEFYFADSVSQIKNIKTWPVTKKTLEVEPLLKFYLNLVQKLYDQIKPKEQ